MSRFALPAPSAVPSRRAFLSWLWLASLGATSWIGMLLVSRTALPRPQAGQRGGPFALGSPAAQPAILPTVDEAPIDCPSGRFWLVNTGDGLLALDQTCTHLDCLLAWSEQTKEFVCPCHGSRFAKDGSRLAGPAPRAMDRFPIQVIGSDGALLAATDANTGAPLALAQFIPASESDTTTSATPAATPAPGTDAIIYTLVVDTSISLQANLPG